MLVINLRIIKEKGEDDTKGEARRDFEEYWKEVFGYVQGEFTNKKFKEGG